jgi:cytoskeleton protein RodZ
MTAGGLVDDGNSQDGADAVERGGSGARAAEDAPAQSAPESESEGAGETTPQSSAATPRGRLTLTVSGESWVDIRDAGGGQVLRGLISGPDPRSVSGQPPFTLVIGDAGAVSLQYDGEPVPLERFTRGDVARFQWPPDS